MKKTTLVALAGALLVAGSARAATTQGKSDPNKSQPNAGMHAASSAKHASAHRAGQSVVGTVESVRGDTLTLKNRMNQSHQLFIGNDTRFLEHGKQISKKDLKEGEEVRASFREGQGGKLQATEISVIRSGSTSSEGSHPAKDGSRSSETRSSSSAAGSSKPSR